MRQNDGLIFLLVCDIIKKSVRGETQKTWLGWTNLLLRKDGKIMNKNENGVLRKEISKFLAIQYFTCPDLEEVIANAFSEASFHFQEGESYFDKHIEILKALRAEIDRCINQGERLTSNTLMEYLIHTFENHHLKFSFFQLFVNKALESILILNRLFEDCPIPVDEEKCDCPINSYFTCSWSKNAIDLPLDFCWQEMSREEYSQIQEQVSKYLKERGYEHVGNIFFAFLRENELQTE